MIIYKKDPFKYSEIKLKTSEPWRSQFHAAYVALSYAAGFCNKYGEPIHPKGDWNQGAAEAIWMLLPYAIEVRPSITKLKGKDFEYYVALNRCSEYLGTVDSGPNFGTCNCRLISVKHPIAATFKRWCVGKYYPFYMCFFEHDKGPWTSEKRSIAFLKALKAFVLA